MKKWDEDESYGKKSYRGSKKMSKTKFKKMAQNIYQNRDEEDFDDAVGANGF